MNLQKIGVFLKDFTEIHNLPVHSIQQFGKRWKSGSIVSCEKTIKELLEKGAPLRIFIEHVENVVSEVVEVVSEVEQAVDSFKKGRNKKD